MHGTVAKLSTRRLSSCSVPVIASAGVFFTLVSGDVSFLWLFGAAFACIAASIGARGLARRSRRFRSFVVVVVGLSIACVASASIALRLEQSSVKIAVPANVTAITGAAESDLFVDVAGTYRIDLVPTTITCSDGTQCESSSFAGSTISLFSPLGAHLYKGEVITVSNLSVVSGSYELPFYQTSIVPARGGFDMPVMRLRAKLFDRINTVRYRLEPASRALLGALFLGITGDDVSDVRYFIRRAGCVHLLALSGMHVAVLIGIILALLSPFLGRRCAGFVAIPIVIAYVLLIGSPPALVRACTMYTIGAILTGIGRRYRPIDVIAGSFVLGAMLQPKETGSLSFLLTYLAVTGIAIGATPWTKWFKRFAPSTIAASLGVSVAAFTATAPVIAASFGVIYPFGIVASLCIALPVSVFLSIGVIVLCLEVLIPIRTVSFFPVYRILEHIATCIDREARFLSALPAAIVQTYPVVILSSLLWVFILRRFGSFDPVQLAQRGK